MLFLLNHSNLYIILFQGQIPADIEYLHMDIERVPIWTLLQLFEYTCAGIHFLTTVWREKIENFDNLTSLFNIGVGRGVAVV